MKLSIFSVISGLLPWKSIINNVLLPASLNGKNLEEMRTKAEALLKDFRLFERRDDFPYRLSEGEKQIVNIVRCVCTPAKVVLLDEPFAALNSYAKSKARSLITNIAKSRTVVLVTHDPADCDLPFTRFLLISESTVVEVDSSTAKEFLSNAVSKT